MAKTPKIRFKNFSDEWENNNLGEICKIIKGEQINKLSLLENGKYYVLNGGISPSGYINTYNTLENTISISEGGNSCGYVKFNIEKFWSGGHNYTLNELKTKTLFLYSSEVSTELLSPSNFREISDNGVSETRLLNPIEMVLFPLPFFP